MQALAMYLKNNTYSEKSFFGITYRIYANGRVAQMEGGAEINLFTKGGSGALKVYLENLYKKDYSEVTINGVAYWIYDSGKVTYASGSLILKTGGQAGLIEWIKIQSTVTYKTLVIEGEQFTIWSNGTINDHLGFFFMTGTRVDLEAYFAPKFMNATINDVEYLIWYEDNRTTTANGVDVVLASGGFEALKVLIQHSLDNRYQIIFDGGFKYYIYHN